VRDHRFTVHGTVDGRAATARWEGGRLHADDELRRRVDVVIAMGEEFQLEAGTVPAAVAGGITAALLTVLRAFSAVTTVDIDLRTGEPGRDEAGGSRGDAARRAGEAQEPAAGGHHG
jgi:hypothetical protein